MPTRDEGHLDPRRVAHPAMREHLRGRVEQSAGGMPQGVECDQKHVAASLFRASSTSTTMVGGCCTQ